MIYKHILEITFLNVLGFIFLHTVKWFHLFLSNMNNCVLFLFFYFVCTIVKWFQVLLSNTNNSIKHQSFVYTQLNAQTVLFQISQFNTSYLFAHSLNVKQFYLTHR